MKAKENKKNLHTEQPREKAEGYSILRLNLCLLAVCLQAGAWNLALQPVSAELYEVFPSALLLAVRFLPLLLCSLWMAHNLRWEADPAQRVKNRKTEGFYFLVQAGIFLFALHSRLSGVGTLLLLAAVLFYVFYINPKKMNRVMYRSKKYFFRE